LIIAARDGNKDFNCSLAHNLLSMVGAFRQIWQSKSAVPSSLDVIRITLEQFDQGICGPKLRDVIVIVASVAKLPIAIAQ